MVFPIEDASQHFNEFRRGQVILPVMQTHYGDEKLEP